jgi:hypothetical protein
MATIAFQTLNGTQTVELTAATGPASTGPIRCKAPDVIWPEAEPQMPSTLNSVVIRLRGPAGLAANPGSETFTPSRSL